MRRGEAGAPSPLRFGAARPGASTGRRARRLIGAPTAPPPPRCAIRPRERRSSRGSAFVASRSAAWRRRAASGTSSAPLQRPGGEDARRRDAV